MTIDDAPEALRAVLDGAEAYDSSCSAQARVWFVDKGDGLFLKCAAAGTLMREADMTRYFHGKGLSAEVLDYISGERDWLLTRKIPGEDCTARRYLDQPERLCDILAERLALLHGLDFSGCPEPNHTDRYLARARENYLSGDYDSSHFPDSYGYACAEDAMRVIETRGHLLQRGTLLHGDCCLPNVILNDWAFSGFIDLGGGGVGDRHVDIFWALWSLWFNLKTGKYRERFIDAYGRANVDEEMLRIVAAVEVFG